MGYKAPIKVSLSLGAGAMTPWVNSATRFFGRPTQLPVASPGVPTRVYSPVKGNIRGVIYCLYSNTTAGSDEPWELFLRVNDTTDYSIGAVATTGPDRIWSKFDLNIPINVGEFINLKSVNPAWATPPSDGAGYYAQGTIIIDTD